MGSLQDEAISHWPPTWPRFWAIIKWEQFPDASTSDKRAGKSILDSDPRIRKFRTKAKLRILFSLIWLGICVFFLTHAHYLDFLDESPTTIMENIKSTASKLHGNLAQSYEDFRNPGNPQEIADLMTEWYELLSKMGYYEPMLIERPPHTNPSINRTFAAQNGFSERAIAMMEMLPYLGLQQHGWAISWRHGEPNDLTFIFDGGFLDYRDEESLTYDDPFYAVEKDDGQKRGFEESGGRYMKPDYVLLSSHPEQGAIMVLNTNNCRF